MWARISSALRPVVEAGNAITRNEKNLSKVIRKLSRVISQQQMRDEVDVKILRRATAKQILRLINNI